MISPADWLLFLLAFVVVLALAIGIEAENRIGGAFLMLAGIAAIFLGIEAFTLTGSTALGILIGAVGTLILISGIPDITAAG